MSDRVKLHPKDGDVKPPRRYASALREEQARETRARILKAARRLFVERGYGATTIEAIAREAGVAVQTVYAAFGSKRTILQRVMDRVIGGDDRPVGVLEREGPQRTRQEPDQRRQLRQMAHGIGQIMERAGPVFAVMRAAAAADPEIAALYRGIQEERRANMARVVGWVAANGPLGEGLGTDEAADIVWSLTSADVHHLLTADRGWTTERYERWLGEALIAALLP
jgi:AcrR family transcriptional regulator